MLETIIKPIEKVISSRLEKTGLKKEMLKHPNYVTKAKEIWDMIDEDFGISNTIENMLKLKMDKFDQTLISKFPELTQKDITELKENIIGEISAGKDALLNQVYGIKQLQDINAKLKEENEKLKNQLSQIQAALPSIYNKDGK
ncbi:MULTISPECIES: hypothetical protein [unclassified Clostridium]|uniref:hypothetical protein n=1 Tax=unclassified Clostridium TaxID=2614128 RepID=UPI0002978450|nr:MULTISPECIES: hypothetical protein [unclassified Clostridium]EKQ51725.1 MAG: hypothetical protein A370_04710 [Clostridium sp. Maddingley MBC34-26]